MWEKLSKWDSDVIYDLFQSRDAGLIKQIPLPIQDKVDSWFWMLDEKGEYKVKSGYRWMQGEFDGADICYGAKLVSEPTK